MTYNVQLLNDKISYLKNNILKNKISSLIINIETDTTGEFIHLVLIKIKPSQQNKGYGNLILDHLIKFADTYKLRIKIQLIDFLNKNKLIGFYRKHGFTLIKNNEFDMVYYPK